MLTKRMSVCRQELGFAGSVRAADERMAGISSELTHSAVVASRRPYIRRGPILTISLVALTIVCATAFRLASLDARPFWVDEAESSINALTILEKGYPADSYLGLPIYENTLVKRWPGNPEYEFRDISYTEKHFAIYHGWLPLYAIAASFALQHIRPDEAGGKLSVKYGLDEWKRRTRAARFPGVLFGAAFLLIAFWGGSVMYGRDAGWAALIVGSIHSWHFTLSREARYYSAQITLTAACCVLLWLMLQRCTWKRTCVAALAFVLLFHTHLLSFCTAMAVFLAVVPVILRRHVRALSKLTAFVAVVVAGTLPWILITGFYAHQSGIPRAWPMLRLPADFFRYPPLALSNAIIGSAVVLLVGFLAQCGDRVSMRLRAPAARLAPVLLYLSVWAAIGYAAFLRFMPAVSFASNRISLSYWGPLFLLEAAICAAVARVLSRRLTAVLAPAAMLLLFFAGGHRVPLLSPAPNAWKPLQVVFAQLDAMHLASGTKLYAASNRHLILTFYSGLPIQDITPVRKTYLDSYSGDIVFIDSGIAVDTGVLTPERVRQTAAKYGDTLSPSAAGQWIQTLRTREYRETVLKVIEPGSAETLEPLPPFARALLFENERKAAALFSGAGLDLVTRGFDIHDWNEWRVVLKYRFVDPAAHSGIHANYAERFRGAQVNMLPQADTVLYYSAASKLASGAKAN